MSTKSQNESSLQKIHTISSNVRQKGDSITKLPSKKRAKLDFDRYLVGRSYQLFKSAIKVDVTLEFYRRNLYYFCDYIGKTTEQITEQHGPYKKVNGKNRPNIEGIQELQRAIENYVLTLQERVGRNEIKASSCVARMPAVKLFTEMNDISGLNWKKINKLLPSSDLVADDEAYSRDQIKKMLQFCDLRTAIIVLFLASSGMRLGGLTRFDERGQYVGLKHGHLKPIYDKTDSKVLAVHVRVYADTQDEYDTFISPEAWQIYTEYIKVREQYGEKITKDSPVLLSRFGRTTLAEGKGKPIDPSTVQNLLAAIRDKAGVNIRSAQYNDRYTIKQAHGFRKFFLSTLKQVKSKDGLQLIPFVNRERLLGHTLVEAHALEDNYDRSNQTKELLQSYLLALPELTTSDEARLALQVKTLETDVKTLRTVEVRIDEKDKQLHEISANYEKRVARLERIILGLKSHIDDDLGPLASSAVEGSGSDI